MNKHTSEPWELVCEEPYDLRLRGDGHTICTFQFDDAFPMSGDDGFNDRQQANARLIAAAPELLEQLRHAVDVLSNTDLAAHSEKMRAVIAKAEGRS